LCVGVIMKEAIDSTYFSIDSYHQAFRKKLGRQTAEAFFARWDEEREREAELRPRTVEELHTLFDAEITAEARRIVRALRPKALPRNPKAPPTPNDLTKRWWSADAGILEKSKEAELIRRAQSGDRRAATELFRHFNNYIAGVAGRHMRGRQQGNWNKQTNGLFEDLVAAGAMGFCEALNNFDLSLGFRFSTAARKRICGAISDETTRFRKRGKVDESDIGRWLDSHSHLTPEAAAAGLRKAGLKWEKRFLSPWEVNEKLEAIKAWGQRESYADDPRAGGGGDDINRACEAEYKEFTRTRWTTHASRKLDPIDKCAVDNDCQASRRLAVLGRRRYAVAMVEQLDKSIAARAGEEQYLYRSQTSLIDRVRVAHNCNHYGEWPSASAKTERIKPRKSHRRKRRRSVIRSWRCNSQTPMELSHVGQ